MKTRYRLALVALAMAHCFCKTIAADKSAPAIVLLDSDKTNYLGSTIELALNENNVLGKKLIDTLTGNTALVKKLQLYINDVPMKGIEPQLYKDTAGYPLVVKFALTRDSRKGGNGDTWDQVFDRMNNQNQKLALSYNSEPSLEADKTLRFQACEGIRGIATAVSALGLFVLLMWWAVASGMLRDAGPGTAYSLGRTQMAFWVLLIAISFLAIFTATGDMERLPDQALTLMGISGATGLSAVLIGNSKKASAATGVVEKQAQASEKEALTAGLKERIKPLEALDAAGGTTPAQKEELGKLNSQVTSNNQALQELNGEINRLKLEATASPSFAGPHGWLKDIVSDGNGLSFARFQACLWTLILGGIFIYSVCQRITMPEFDSTLLTLMGISNLVYIGFKFPEKAG
ncbi:MAG TPA: hypothetical protein PLX89_24440 [Verrucomicrobiota bacterium]|nr:hypothetical protein [Verrucomicrobiales bacterium]HRI16157.1 hypothetical protein [Verrucomicrobiota bacterium]